MRRSEQNIADGGDRVKRLFGTPASRAKLCAIFPDDDTFAQFDARMSDERAMRGSYDFLRGGSNTAEKLVDAGEAGGLSGLGTLLGRALSNPKAAAMQVGQATVRRAVQGQSLTTAEAIARRAALGPDEKDALLRYLEQLRATRGRAAVRGTRSALGTGNRSSPKRAPLDRRSVRPPSPPAMLPRRPRSSVPNWKRCRA
jgi:hypothetical protein